MQLFYVPDLNTGLQPLPPDEARHAMQVLRHGPGDTLDLVDGKGGFYTGTIVEASKRHCLLDVQLREQHHRRRPYRLTLAVAPTKSNDRFEWFLEKATEIGIDRIIPLNCRHSERRKARIDRYEKVVISAMKQSLQPFLPEVTELTGFSDCIRQEASTASRYIAWIDDQPRPLLANTYPAGNDVIILIGPEGGFSKPEVEEALAGGFSPVSLGPNRLRTETAALAAVHTIEMINWQQPSK